MYFVVCLPLVVFPAAAANGPAIACTNSVFAFGMRDNKHNIKHDFVLENRGDRPLNISRIHGCCGASVGVVSSNIPPGTNTVLHTTLSLKGRKGKVNKSIYVHSNDPVNPILQLKFKGSIVRPVDLLTDNRKISGTTQ